MQQMTPGQVEKLLQEYYDIPQKIKGELAEIRDLEEEQQSICTPAPQLSGMPGGKGGHGDPVAVLATKCPLGYEDGIQRCRERIAELREHKNWICVALESLDRTDREILSLAYMGPQEPRERKQWTRRPPWKEIADKVGYSISQTYDRARASKQMLADLSTQTIIPGMER